MQDFSIACESSEFFRIIGEKTSVVESPDRFYASMPGVRRTVPHFVEQRIDE
jgi:hypothetical protein